MVLDSGLLFGPPCTHVNETETARIRTNAKNTEQNLYIRVAETQCCTVETAKILPAVFGTWRYDKTYNPYSDIRKNLFNHYDSKLESDVPPSCVLFSLLVSSSHLFAPHTVIQVPTAENKRLKAKVGIAVD